MILYQTIEPVSVVARQYTGRNFKSLAKWAARHLTIDQESGEHHFTTRGGDYFLLEPGDYIVWFVDDEFNKQRTFAHWKKEEFENFFQKAED